MTPSEIRQIAKAVVRELTRQGIIKEAVQPERYMTAKEAAAYMAMPIHTLYKKIDEIPHVKRGRLVFSERSLQEYMSGKAFINN